SISFGQQRMTAIAASVAGGLVAFYQIGYGLAAFGVGPLEEAAGLSLGNIYGLAIVVAVAMFAVALLAVRSRPQPVESLA
ncbi:MAG: MFS transporter, partial [Anaerolineae bacterium]|nr:MFS transporter [Anaerolineae bacterium]